MNQVITSVDIDSVADELGILAGMELVAIDGEPIRDIIDYEQLSAAEKLTLTILDDDGNIVDVPVEKDLYEPLGLSFANGGLMSPIRSCRNHCVFCFIDQMPKGVRDSLHVKDDDWRLSLIMGNYVTLTNVDDEEFDRIIKRHVSPLYVSVHATDPDVRRRMMGNPSAVRIMERLAALKDAGIQFHCQIVLCPGLNDKEVLERTISDLYSLCPAAQSLAVVPVGLTRFRDKLFKLRCLTKQEACEAIDTIERWQKMALDEQGTSFVFPSDEMYILAGRRLPEAESYEGYCQIENGVGLLRKFEEEFLYALEEKQPLKNETVFDSASGVSAAPFMQKLFDRLLPYGIRIKVHPIVNRYFGETVTVSGLITAGDLYEQLEGALTSDTLLIPHNMMRERDDVFLDGTRLPELEKKLGVKVSPIWATDGEVFINELFDMLG
ncbi:MAG: DUF512 domain-containing protein [Clostridia bacterium]|nr:DUF512 domain-containing protein [Clostridia bacterium]